MHCLRFWDTNFLKHHFISLLPSKTSDCSVFYSTESNLLQQAFRFSLIWLLSKLYMLFLSVCQLLHLTLIKSISLVFKFSKIWLILFFPLGKSSLFTSNHLYISRFSQTIPFEIDSPFCLKHCTQCWYKMSDTSIVSVLIELKV